MSGLELKQLIEIVWEGLQDMKFNFIGYESSLAELIIYGSLLLLFARFFYKILS